MARKNYYSMRKGTHPDQAQFTLPALKKLVLAVFEDFRSRQYFDEPLGYSCVDAGEVPGSLGTDVNRALLIALRKDNLWPINERIESYSEDDLLDVLEFLHDHVSKPVDGRYHDYSNCGMHYETFSKPEGQAEFREEISRHLECYASGYHLTEAGEIQQLPDPGMAPLLKAPLPGNDPENIQARVDAAKSRFLRHHSSLEDRKVAIRDLADVLEFIRPRLVEVIDKGDQADLFNIANNFGIRHHNEKQKIRYDRTIWYSWMFYYYLATIHACQRLLARHNASKGP